MSTIEINQAGVSLKVHQGFLKIQREDETESIPLDQIDCIIINSYGAVLTNHVLIRLCELSIPLIICGTNAMPIGILNSTADNVYRKERVSSQMRCSIPLQKQLWQSIVKAKIHNQSMLLQSLHQPNKDFIVLEKSVGSGDPTNVEAVAARRYWNRLFPLGFKRDPELPGINAYLNYGYAILRACFCRNIVAKGLLPEFGIFHRNLMNPFCLADDIMEPYRPFVDQAVYAMELSDDCELSPTAKKQLITVLEQLICFDDKMMHLNNCITQSTQSLVDSFVSKKPMIRYPYLDPERL